MSGLDELVRRLERGVRLSFVSGVSGRRGSEEMQDAVNFLNRRAP